MRKIPVVKMLVVELVRTIAGLKTDQGLPSGVGCKIIRRFIRRISVPVLQRRSRRVLEGGEFRPPHIVCHRHVLRIPQHIFATQ